MAVGNVVDMLAAVAEACLAPLVEVDDEEDWWKAHFHGPTIQKLIGHILVKRP